MFRQKAHFSPYGRVARGLAKQFDRPAGGPDQIEQHLDRGRFARPVRTQKAKDLTLGHPEGQVIDGHFAIILFTQVIGFQSQVGHRKSSTGKQADPKGFQNL
jgi:hypothetical protein